MKYRDTEHKIEFEKFILERLEQLKGNIITFKPQHPDFKNIEEITFEIGQNTNIEILPSTNMYFHRHYSNNLVLSGLRYVSSIPTNLDAFNLSTDDNYTYFFNEIWRAFHEKLMLNKQLKNTIS